MSRIAAIACLVTLGVAAAYTGYRYHQRQQPSGAASIHASAAVPSAVSIPALNRQQNNSLQGESRPDFSLPDVSGRMRHISEWDGQVVALNFWATWCQPCLREIPAFIALQQEYAGQGLQFIGIAMQQPREVAAFMEQQGMNYPVLAGEQEVVNLAQRYGNEIGALPYTVIIDRQGKIAFVQYGELKDELARHIISVLL